jgi:hypothetical protein
VITDEVTGEPERSEQIGIELGQRMLAKGAGEILAEIIQHGADR